MYAAYFILKGAILIAASAITGDPIGYMPGCLCFVAAPIMQWLRIFGD